MAMKNTYVIHQATEATHYTADAFIVRCFDDRFRGAFEAFVHARKFYHIDPESVAGGAKIFASPENESDREFMFRELEKSVLLHHTKHVILFSHHDCGAYGGIGRFNGDTEQELAFHAEEHQKARDALRAHFPDLSVETYFMDDSGIIKTSA